MCNNESPPPSKEPLAVGLSVGNSIAGFLPGLEHYRLQLYHYAMTERIRLAQQLHPQNSQNVVNQSPGIGQQNPNSSHMNVGPNFPMPLPLYPTGTSYPRSLALSMALLHPHHQPIPEEPKPQHSYIGLIAMAILSSPEKKLVLSDIYQHILEHYPYFRRRGPGWRNSIRHNLSLNDCFVKSGRSANGKGHYWAIHPANLEDFRRGDFRRRKAQRKVRRHMGLAVDEEPDSPSPPPLPTTPPPANNLGTSQASQPASGIWSFQHQHQSSYQQHSIFTAQTLQHVSLQPSRKRQFDVASLLAPDDQYTQTTLPIPKFHTFSCSEDEQEQEQEQEQDEEDAEVEIDVVAEPQSSLVSSDLSANENRCWKNPALIDSSNQHILPVHTHGHLHIKNYYIPTNMGTGSSI